MVGQNMNYAQNLALVKKMLTMRLLLFSKHASDQTTPEINGAWQTLLDFCREQRFPCGKNTAKTLKTNTISPLFFDKYIAFAKFVIFICQRNILVKWRVAERVDQLLAPIQIGNHDRPVKIVHRAQSRDNWRRRRRPRGWGRRLLAR